ncbi:MAG: FtsX-like permease family protein, partial [Thermodesulfobacteriota bacterium]
EGGEKGLPGLVIGRELSHILGVHVGDRVNMISPLGALGPMGMIPKARGFRVTGIFEAGMYEYDASLAYIDIPHAQDFLNMEDGITGVELRLEDIYEAGRVARRLQARLGYPYHARDWMQMNRNLFAALKLEKIAMFLILTLIILVAAFNIVGTLVMMVIEKSRDIAILKTMGATRRGIMTIFMTQGLFVGILGTALGLAGGYILCYVLQETQLISLPGDVYYLDHLPVHMRAGDFLWVGLAAMLISLLATVYPSLQAAKLDPIEPLRYE